MSSWQLLRRKNGSDWTIRRKPVSIEPVLIETGILRDYTPDIRVIPVKLSADWVVGFVDGEGCFHVSLNKHPEMSLGYQVLPEFVIVQHERDVQILHQLKRFFGGGVVRKNHGDRQCLRIRKTSVLESVCDFFLAHPLKTRKNVDFRRFRKIILHMVQGRHLSHAGLVEIVDIALSMNTTHRPALEEVRRELVQTRIKR